jgi:hypothetical protein
MELPVTNIVLLVSLLGIPFAGALFLVYRRAEQREARAAVHNIFHGALGGEKVPDRRSSARRRFGSVTVLSHGASESVPVVNVNEDGTGLLVETKNRHTVGDELEVEYAEKRRPAKVTRSEPAGELGYHVGLELPPSTAAAR